MISTIPIIGLAGPIGSGKDTLAGMLQKSGFTVKKFAGPLYAMAGAIDPVIRPDMLHVDKQGYLCEDPQLGTRRNFMEKLGTEFARQAINEEFWLILMQNYLDNHTKLLQGVPIVISDVRFENEASMLREAGGHIVHLKPDWATESTGHTSDKGLRYVAGDSILGLSYGEPEKGYKQLLSIIEELYNPARGSCLAR